MIDVSFVIVNWNTRQLLLDCIESIKRETKVCKVEIIVVDNASTDNSAEAVREKYPDVYVIENSVNLGFAKANNIGINKCKGKYICLSNSDVIALDNVVDKMVSYLEKNNDIGALLPMCLSKEMEIDRCCRQFPSMFSQIKEALYLDKLFSDARIFQSRAFSLSFYNSIADVDSIPCCFIMVPRIAIEHVGLLDERFYFYSEDIDWCKRFHANGWRVVYFSNAKIIHLGGSSSKVAKSKFLIERHKSELQYWEKHYGTVKKMIIRSILILHYAIRITGYCCLYMIRSGRIDFIREKMKNYSECLLFLLFNYSNIRNKV